MFSLFIYGNLQFTQVQQILLGRTLDLEPATIPGFTTGMLKTTNIPVIIQDKKRSVQGFIARDIQPSELIILNQFHDSGPVTGSFNVSEQLVVNQKGQIMHAKIYSAKHQTEIIMKEWDKKQYEKKILPSYLQHLQKNYGGIKNEI